MQATSTPDPALIVQRLREEAASLGSAPGVHAAAADLIERLLAERPGVAAGQKVWLLGGVADVYARREDAYARAAKCVREETAYKLKHQDQEIVLHLLDAGKVELALHHFNRCVNRPLPLGSTEVR